MTEASRSQRLGSALFYVVVALLAWLVFRIASPFLVPLGWAGIFAILINPLQKRMTARWGASRAALVSTIGVMVCFVVPGALLAAYFVREGLQAAQSLQDLAASGRLAWAAHVWASLAQRLGMSDVSLSSALQDAAKSVAGFLAGSFGSLVANLVGVVLGLFVMLFALFFFLRDGKKIMAKVRGLLPFEDPLRERLLADAEQLIHASVSVSLVIAIIQGSICGFAFAVAGIGAPIFWALIMSFMALLPVIGAWPVWIPATIWMFATGSIGKGFLLLVLCGGIAGTIDNVMRPILMSDRSRLDGLSIFISVLGGIAAFGMIGLVLGPIIFATALALLDVYTRPAPAK